MREARFEIRENAALRPDVFRLRLTGDCSAVTAPGQFVSVSVEGLFLRRPFSVCDREGDTLTLVYQVKGKGTEALSRMRGGTLDVLTGLGNGPVGEFLASGAMAKMSAAPVQLFTRGILCNMLVCIAVWCGFRCKNEVAKLIMIFWCLLAFFTTGFEHSVANMTVLTYALINPAGQAVTIGGWFYNLILVTLGNMVGGIVFVAIPYCSAAKE